MTREGSLSDEERRKLLGDLSSSPAESDPSWPTDDVLRGFLPLPVHERFFDDHVMIVRGPRGSGKSAFFFVLRALRERGLPTTALFPRARVEQPDWIEGFDATSMLHPSVAALETFVERADDVSLRLFWSMHLIGRLSDDTPRPPGLDDTFFKPLAGVGGDLAGWVDRARSAVPKITAALDGFDAFARAQGRTYFISYDALDRIGLLDPLLQIRAINALLALWLSLGRRHGCLRPKIFVREDVFRQIAERSTDADVLHGRSISLSWDEQALYRLLIRRMAHRSEDLCRWIQRGEGAIPLEWRPPFGWLPPSHLPEEGAVSVKGFVGHLIGPSMGSGVWAGRPHRWIMGRLQDAQRVVTPRALLTLVALAAGEALEKGPKATGDRLLHPHDVRGALEGTSVRHVQAMHVEHRVISRLERLRGSVLPLVGDEVVERLAAPRPGVVDGFGDDGAWVLDELLRIGVMRFRDDGRLDVPDIYRLAFGIKRQGGAARVMRRV